MTQRDRKHGSDILHLAWAVAIGSVAAMTAIFIGVVTARVSAIYVLGCAAGGIGAGFVALWTVEWIAQRSASGVLQFLHPGGRASTEDIGFSMTDALISRGAIHDALAALESFLADHPGHVRGTLRVAAVYTQLGRWDAAVVAYDAARSQPAATSGDRLQASQRLIDLYLGPLADEGAALRELRRLIDTFPGSGAATGARQAIASIKRARQDIPK